MNAPQEVRRLIRLPAVLDRVGLKRATVYKRIKAKQFPAQVRQGGAACWYEDAIEEYVANPDGWQPKQPTT